MVAAAVLEWAIDNDADTVRTPARAKPTLASASMRWASEGLSAVLWQVGGTQRGSSCVLQFCHCWQPMAASGVRHGQVAMVQNKMVEFNGAGQVRYPVLTRALTEKNPVKEKRE